MNPERIRVYYDLISIGIDSESIKAFPGVPQRFERDNNLCFKLETTSGKYALWLVPKEESQLLTELELLRILEESKVEGFLFPVRLKNNSLYSVLRNGCLFYLTDWHELKRISFRNDLNSLLKLIIDFRKVTNSTTFPNIKFKISSKSLVDQYQDMIRSIQSFAMLASYRLHPTTFDQLFIRYWEGLSKEAEFALNLMRDSIYLNLIESKESLWPIINDFSRSNLRTLSNGQAICISLKGTIQDTPLMDLALLMVKSGRANRWSRDWYEHVIKVYNESFPLNDEALGFIRAYLAFPWEAYRLAARYYHNRVNWPVRVFVEKLERIIASNEDRTKLLFI